MKAIRTYVLGPTDHRGTRIVATDDDGNRLVKAYDYSGTEHEDAATALCQKMGWEGRLVRGTIGTGCVFVFYDSTAVFPVGPSRLAGQS